MVVIPDMSHCYTNLNVHLIFHAKAQGCVIAEDDLSRVFHYIGGIVNSLEGHVYTVGGRPDHIHILATLPATKSISDFVRDIKSNTSRWIKGIDTRYQKFAWQEGYGAFAVSASNIKAVCDYISNQKDHHRTRSTQEEFHQFLQKHGIQINYQREF